MPGLLIGPGVGVSHILPAVAAGGPHAVNAVRFNRGDTYIRKATALTGAVDGAKFLCSFWFNFKGADSLFSTVFSALNQDWLIRRTSGNVWDCRAKAPGGTSVFTMAGTTVFTTSTNPGWHHMLVAGDLAAGDPKVQMYIDDVSEVSIVPATGTINFDSTEWEGGRDVAGAGNGIDGEVAELWFDLNFLDLDTESNRRKFIDADKFPVDLGATGQLPLGADPICFFTGDTDAWHTNKGDGGGFTEFGTLVTATSFPSD